MCLISYHSMAKSFSSGSVLQNTLNKVSPGEDLVRRILQILQKKKVLFPKVLKKTISKGGEKHWNDYKKYERSALVGDIR